MFFVGAIHELPTVYAKTAERWMDGRRVWGGWDGIATGTLVFSVSISHMGNS